MKKSLFISILIVFGLVLKIDASVKKIEIHSRETVSHKSNEVSLTYEVIKGIIYLEVDPKNPRNKMIVDLEFAKENKNGLVEFSTEFELHKPLDILKGNRKLIYFVNNRGNKMGNWHFNHNLDYNWLYSNGYSYLWCGWNCDVPESNNRINISVPIINDEGGQITGKTYSEIISYYDELVYSLPIVWGRSIAYEPINLTKESASLSMRKYRDDPAISIPNDKWDFARYEDGEVIPDPNQLFIEEGIKPGWLYDFVYEAKNPKVTGLGMAAIRDVVSFFRNNEKDHFNNANPLGNVIEYAYAWGHSQSARLLNHFVYQDFNLDEKRRIVFDGMMLNCPGAGKGLFNSRFAQFTRHGSQHEENLYPIDFFPFATVKQFDPIANKYGDAFKKARENGSFPKMMFINSSTDYWTRAASLLHTDVTGQKDLEIDKNIRIYAVASKSHVDARLGILGRALLTALSKWVEDGILPPDSEIPRISDGSLVSLQEYKNSFPLIENIDLPSSIYHPLKLNLGARWEKRGIADIVPPKVEGKYVSLVPQCDEDGNDIAGIRLPEIYAPLATYTGWRKRNPSFSNSISRNYGAKHDFLIKSDVKATLKDSRKAITERYKSKEDYLFEVTKSLLNLKTKKLILDEDITKLFFEASEKNYWSQETANSIKANNISIEPTEIAAGDSILISYNGKNTSDSVLLIKAKFREANNYSVNLNDLGEEGDIHNGDGIWSKKVKIPDDVPNGIFHFDLLIQNKNLEIQRSSENNKEIGVFKVK